MNKKKWKNPILPGFYPDPSVCRVGEDYYLVNSTFACFPGVPIFRSRDLLNWTQIGNILDRPSQLPLGSSGHSEGIYAPTIRYHEGTYYMVTTNVGNGGNFLVKASDPAGPWSDPCWLEGADGFDPNLIFEDDGTCYYIGTKERSEGGTYNGDNEIWIQKLNLETMKLEGEPTALWYGFMKHAIWPEGPHILKKDEWYYILYAETGTAFEHCIAVARSRNLMGPYEGNRCNPIFTHRHLGKQYPITCVGHADLVDDGKGNWYMVMLACRPWEGYTLMGRETFLAEVVWEDDWPVVNPGVGHLIPGEEDENAEKYRKSYSFAKDQWPMEMLRLRTPGDGVMEMQDGTLRMHMAGASLRDKATPAFAAVRQQHHHFAVETTFRFSSDCSAADCAGLGYMQNEDNQIRAEVFGEAGHRSLRVVNCVKGTEEEISSVPAEAGEAITLRFEVSGRKASVYYRGQKEWITAAEDICLTHLSTEEAGGFVGCIIGMYASGSGQNNGAWADFTDFLYEEI